jgi:hypothetical protein
MRSEDENAPREQRNADEHPGHTDTQLPTAGAKFEIPPSAADCNKSRKQEKHLLDYATFLMEFLAFVVLCTYAAYTIKIYGANQQAAEASTKASQTAACALVESKRQFQDTLREMRSQTGIQKTAAAASLLGAKTSAKQVDLAAQQMEQAKRTNSARLIVQNFMVEIQPVPHQDNAKVLFDVVNVGNSEATEIAEYGGPRTVEYRDDYFAETAQVGKVDPAGYSLAAKEPRHFEISAAGWASAQSARKQWFTWKRLTFLNIYGEMDSICILITGSKHGLDPRTCWQEPPPKQTR